MNPIVISIAVAVIALASLAGAVALQWQGYDSSQAWAAFIGSFGVLAGQQMETPTARGVGK
jgi:hypothetical protein